MADKPKSIEKMMEEYKRLRAANPLTPEQEQEEEIQWTISWVYGQLKLSG